MASKLSSTAGPLRIDRELAPLGPDTVRMDQRYAVRGVYTGHLVTGAHWLFSAVWLRAGRAQFLVGDEKIAAPPRFALFMPPFSLIRVHWHRAVIESLGVLSSATLRTAQGRARLVASEVDDPHQIASIDRTLAGGGDDVEMRAAPGSPVARAKRLIDRDTQVSMREVASQIGVAPATLTRSFRRELGLTPLDYRHRLQLMGALVELAQGTAIASAAFGSGFGDLSTFYRQFGRHVHARPSQYRKARR